MNNQVVMDKFFKLLKQELESIDILDKPEHIFNADETGIDLNARSGKVIVCKNSKHAYSEQKAPRDHITFMVCCSASGQVLQPMIIFEKNWRSGPYSRNGPDGCLYGKSPYGYMDEELFLTWFEEIFVVGTSHVQPTVLIIDGHGSHITYSVIKRAVDENIKIILFSPNTTNVLQLLNVGLFRSLKANLPKVTHGVKMLSVTGDYQNINKTNFTAIFKKSFEKSMSLATIKKRFRKTGIYPFNPEGIDKTRLIPIEPSPSSTPIIATSTLSGVESTPDENLEKSEHNFTITSSEKTPLDTATSNSLTKINIEPEYLANVIHLPSSERNKKPYKPRFITKGRAITDKEHQALYKEKEKKNPGKKKRRKIGVECASLSTHLYMNPKHVVAR